MKKAIIRISIFSLLVVTAIAVISYRIYLYVSVKTDPPASGGYYSKTVNWDGASRRYQLYVPANLPVSPAVVVVLHGFRGRGEVIRRQTAYQFDIQAEKHGFIVVYPDGFQQHWNDCRASASYTANTEDVDDIGFINSILDETGETYNAGLSERYIVGYSNGGHMVYKIALANPGMFGAYAVVAANLPVAANRDCHVSGEPVNISILNGSNDPVNPYQGGEVVLMGDHSRGAVLSSQESLHYFADLVSKSEMGQAENTDAPFASYKMAERDGNAKTVVEVQELTGDYEVSLYTLRGSGHVIPTPYASFGSLYGGDAGDIDLADELLKRWRALAIDK